MQTYILCGGSGNRLWPVSRPTHPKQFCELFDEALLAKTIRRLLPKGTPRVITHQSMRVLTESLYRDLGLSSTGALYEPVARNTAAAIALACRQLELENRSQEVVAIFPADHLIENTEEFNNALALAETYAKKGEMVTLGIKPTEPATGFGYIELNDVIHFGNGVQALQAVAFKEKPPLEMAKRYVEWNRHLWNAGMFVFQVSSMIRLLQKYQPEIWSAMQQLKSEELVAGNTHLAQVYATVPSISIDYGIMEHLPSHTCIACPSLTWSDVGSWDEVARVTEASTTPDPTSAQVITHAAQNNFVFHQAHPNKVYALAHVNDLLIVDTADALLVTQKNKSQAVKELYQKIETSKDPKIARTAKEHTYEQRPWGRFDILKDETHFKSKKITVAPGQQLSLQSHQHRAEHWILVKGEGIVTLDAQEIPVKYSSHVFIPQGAKHRIKNTGNTPLEFIEVQVGSSFDESDIQRYQDDYQR